LIGRTAVRRPGVLRQPDRFEAILRSGIRVSTRNFIARALANELAIARLGLVAGRRAAPRAVDRNRAKRLVREAFRGNGGLFGGYDVTIQWRGDLRAFENGAIRAELGDLLDSLRRRSAAAGAAVLSTTPHDR
jgi:ribonuclease P protein component